MKIETLKILYFSLGYSTHDHRFLKAIVEGGHEAFFVQLEGSARQMDDRPMPEGVTQVLWKGGRKPFRWRSLPSLVLDFRRLTREIKPDLVHAGPIQTCAFLTALSGFRPLLSMSWGYDLTMDADKNAWMRWVTRYTLQRSAFFVCDANVTREKAMTFGMNPEHITVFPWGVDLNHFRPQKEGNNQTAGNHHGSEGAQRKSFTLFCNRTWEPIYGVDVLAKAFVKVAGVNPDVNLILLGGGSQGGHIRQILMNGGVMERVHFGGWVSQRDLPRWYHMADLYISPSHVDGSSVSLMEALACGLPCLVSDIPANMEWIEAGVNGWLFRDGDADHLAAKILEVMAQREKLPEMGRAARRSAERRADWKENAAALMKAYRDIHAAGAK